MFEILYLHGNLITQCNKVLITVAYFDTNRNNITMKNPPPLLYTKRGIHELYIGITIQAMGRKY